MAPTLACKLEEFKAGVAEFCRAAPSCNRESLENGMKGVSLMYLGLQATSPSDVPIAVSFLDYATRRYLERDRELIQEAAE